MDYKITVFELSLFVWVLIVHLVWHQAYINLLSERLNVHSSAILVISKSVQGNQRVINSNLQQKITKLNTINNLNKGLK